MSSEKGVKKELSDFAKDFGSQGSRNGKGTAVLPPKLGCPHPTPSQRCSDNWLISGVFYMICVALWDMILRSSRVCVYWVNCVYSVYCVYCSRVCVAPNSKRCLTQPAAESPACKKWLQMITRTPQIKYGRHDIRYWIWYCAWKCS